MNDRVLAGILAGGTAGLAMYAVDWIQAVLGLTSESLLDWASVITLGRLPQNAGEVLLTRVGQLGFAGFLGVVFAILFLGLERKPYLVNGWVYALAVWSAVYTVSILFALPGLTSYDFAALASHFLSASVYGVVLGQGLAWIDRYAEIRF